MSEDKKGTISSFMNSDPPSKKGGNGDDNGQENKTTSNGTSTISRFMNSGVPSPSEDISYDRSFDSHRAYMRSVHPESRDVDLIRAQSQSIGSQAWRAIVGSVVPAGLGLIETAGGIGELSGYLMDEIQGKDYTMDFSNDLTEWARESKEEFRSGEPSNFLTGILGAGQIYKEDPGAVFDAGDWAHWFSLTNSAVTSILEFGATGLGLGAAAKGIGSLALRGAVKAAPTALTGTANIAGKSIPKLLQGTKAGQIAARAADTGANLATSFGLAATEGMRNGAQVYREIEEDYLQRNPGEYEKASKVGAVGAAHTFMLNTALVGGLNITSVMPLMRTLGYLKKTGATKGMFSQGMDETIPQFASRLKSIAEGATGVGKNRFASYLADMLQEGVEEQVALVAEYRGKAIGGGEVESAGAIFQEYIDKAFTPEGLRDFFVGAIAGAGQRGIVSNLPVRDPETGRRVRGQRLRDRQVSSERMSAANRMLRDIDLIRSKQDALSEEAMKENPDPIKLQNLREDIFDTTLFGSVENGTTDVLKGVFHEIANLDNSQVDNRGMTQAMKAGVAQDNTDNQYKETAYDRIRQLENIERESQDLISNYNSEQVPPLLRSYRKVQKAENVFNDTYRRYQKLKAEELGGLPISPESSESAMEGFYDDINAIEGAEAYMQATLENLKDTGTKEQIEGAKKTLKKLKERKKFIKEGAYTKGVEDLTNGNKRRERKTKGQETGALNHNSDINGHKSLMEAAKAIAEVARDNHVHNKGEGLAKVTADYYEELQAREEYESRVREDTQNTRVTNESPSKVGDLIEFEGRALPLKKDKFGRWYVKTGHNQIAIIEDLSKYKKLEKIKDNSDQPATEKGQPSQPTDKPSKEVEDTGVTEAVENTIKNQTEQSLTDWQENRIDRTKTNLPFSVAYRDTDDQQIGLNQFIWQQGVNAEGRKVRLTPEKNSEFPPKGKKGSEEWYNTYPIKVEVLNEEGNVETVNNNPVQAYMSIRDPKKDNPDSSYYYFRKNIVDGGTSVESSIEMVGGGFIASIWHNKNKQGLPEKLSNLPDVVAQSSGQESTIQLAVSEAEVGYIDEKGERVGEILQVPNLGGRIFWVNARNYRKHKAPINLVRSKLGELEANVVLDVYKKLLSGDLDLDSDYTYDPQSGDLRGIESILESDRPLISGLKPREVLNLLIWEGPSTFDKNDSNGRYKHSPEARIQIILPKKSNNYQGYVKYGNNKIWKGGKIPNELRDFVKNKFRHVDRTMINQKFSQLASNKEGWTSSEFRFMGSNFNRDSNYNDLILRPTGQTNNISEPALKTDLPTDKPIFVHPHIKLANRIEKQGRDAVDESIEDASQQSESASVDNPLTRELKKQNKGEAKTKTASESEQDKGGNTLARNLEQQGEINKGETKKGVFDTPTEESKGDSITDALEQADRYNQEPSESFNNINTTEEKTQEKQEPVKNDDQKKKEEEEAIRRQFDEEYGGFDGPVNLREVNTEVKSYKFANVEEEIAWLKKRFPNINTRMVNGYIRSKKTGRVGHGAFMNSMVLLSDIAEHGTIYHEAFHVVWNLYLSETDKEAIRKEYPDFKNDKAREEHLAEEFRNYVIMKGEKDVPSRARKFFDDLIRWIREIFGFTTTRDLVFERINAGHYSTQPVDAITENVYRMREVRELSAEQAEAMVDVITYGLFKNIKSIDEVKTIYRSEAIKVLGGTAKKIIKVRDELSAEGKDVSRLENVIPLYRKAIYDEKAQQEVMGRLEERMAVLGFNKVEDYHAVKDADDRSYFEFSSKENATAQAKWLVGTIPESRYVNGEVKNMPNEISGFFKLVDFGKAWGKVMNGLSDIVSDNEKLAYQRMEEKINELAKSDSFFVHLRDKLNSIEEEWRKNQFFSSVSVATNNQTNVIQQQDGTMRAGTANTRNQAQRIRNSWASAFSVSGLFNDRGQIIDEKRNELVERYKKIKNRSTKILNLTKDEQRKLYKDYESLLNDIGVNVSADAIKYLMSHSNNPMAELSNIIVNTGRVFEKGTMGYGIAGITKDYRFDPENNPISDENIMTRLANAEAFVNPESSENVILSPEGKLFWIYSVNNYLSATVNRLRQGRYVDFLQGNLNERGPRPYQRNSRIISAVRSNPEAISFSRFNNYRKEDDFPVSDNTYNDLSPSEDISMRMKLNKEGYMQMFTFADKAHLFLIKDESGNILMRGTLKDPRGKTFSDEAVNQFYYYFFDEYASVAKARQDVLDLPDSKLIKNYHYPGDKTPADAKNAVASGESEGMGRGLFISDIFGDTVESNLLYDNGRVKKIDYNNMQIGNQDNSNKIRRRIADELQNRLNSFIQYAIDNGVITRDTDGSLSNGTLNPSLIQSYPGETQSDKITNMFADYVVNTKIGKIETTKIFTGPVSYYKHYEDFIKRVAGVIAPGKDPIIRDRKDYNVLMANSVEGINTMRPEWEGKMRENMKKLKFTDEQINSEMETIRSPYEEADIADAAGVITVDRAMEILHDIGSWRPEFDDAFRRIKKGEPIPSDYQLFLHSFKGVHFELKLDPESEEVSPIYLKYSQAILFPALVSGTPLDKLRQKMEETDTHEAVFASGIKTGQRNLKTIHDENGELDVDAVNRLSSSDVVKLTKFNWRLQQENPHHEGHERKVGTQLNKNVFANTREGVDYKVDQDTYTHEELDRHDAEISIELSKRGKGPLYRSLGIEGGRVTRIDKMSRTLKNQLQRRTQFDNELEAIDVTTENEIGALDTDRRGTQFKLPLSLTPYSRGFEASVAKMFNRSRVDMKLPGNLFIQMPSFGVKKISDPTTLSKVRWFKNEIEPPRFDKDGNLIGGDILLPYNAIEKIPGHEGMSDEELKKKIDEGALQVVGYRIPNQTLSSTDMFNIAGILPPETGDQAIPYAAIVPKTDSDFDIDKIFVHMPNVRWNGNRLEKTPYFNIDTNNEEELAKVYRDRFKGKDEELKANLEFLQYTSDQGEFDNSLADEIQELFGYEINEDTNIDELIRKVNNNETAFIKRNKGKPVSQINSTEALQNRKLDLFKSVLTNENHFYELMSPIGGGKLKKYQQYDLEVPGQRESEGGMSFISPERDLETKYGYVGGSKGISLIANILADHSISKALKIKSPIGLGFGEWKEGVFEMDLSQRQDENKRLISSNLSEIAVGFLDIANDAFIIDLNITPETTDVAGLLMRAGKSPEWVAEFMSQPIIKEWIKAEKRKGSFERNAVRQRIEKNAPNIEGTDFNNVLSIESMREGRNNEQRQYGIGSVFLNLRDTASLMTEQMLNSQFDSGIGTGLAEARVKLNRARSTFTNNDIQGYEEKLQGVQSEYINAGRDYLSSMSSFFLSEARGSQFVTSYTASALGRNLVDEVGGVTNEDTAQAVYNEIMTAVRQGIGAFHASPSKVKEMFFGGNDSVANKMHLYKRQFKENALLEYIQPVPAREGEISYVRSASERPKDKLTNDKIVEAWRNLIHYDDPNNPEFSEAVRSDFRDLVSYTIYATGGRKTLDSLARYIPVDYMFEQGAGDQIRNLHAILANPDTKYHDSVVNTLISQIMRNNVGNRDLMKYINIAKISNKMKSVNTDKGMISSFKVKFESVPSFTTENRPSSPLPYVFNRNKKLRRNILYELQGVDKDGWAYYQAVNPLGYNERGKKFKEYDIRRDNKDINSIAPDNQLPSTHFPYDRSKLLDPVPHFRDLYEEHVPFVTTSDVQPRSPEGGVNQVDTEQAIGDMSAPKRMETYSLHSGGASGADSRWASIGREFGLVSENHYYVEGNKTPEGNSEISKEEAKEADPKLRQANEILGRKYPTKSEYTNNLLRRNWQQVKNSDAVYAVSTINNNKVEGGTGWAVHMAINEGKPVYVFDQEDGVWYTWQDNKFRETETPILTGNFAGIGTREINDLGEQAIREVYQKTVDSQETAPTKSPGQLSLFSEQQGESEDLPFIPDPPSQLRAQSFEHRNIDNKTKKVCKPGGRNKKS